MKHIIAAESEIEFQHYYRISQEILPKLKSYLAFLESENAVTHIPGSILWTGYESACYSLSSIPLPAYTNEFRTVFCPDLTVWKHLYLQQIDGQEMPDVRSYYENSLSLHHLLQILGHEFVHHSDFFIDEVYEKSRWFEEGMCEYISRKYFLTDDEFQAEMQINRLLVKQFSGNYPIGVMEHFTADTYAHHIPAIFFEYWRSFLAVQQIVERFHGDLHEVFRSYHRWAVDGSAQPLSEWFSVSI